MTIKIRMVCDNCGAITRVADQYFANNADKRLGDVPRSLSFFEMPGQKHLCFNCALQTVPDDES